MIVAITLLYSPNVLPSNIMNVTINDGKEVMNSMGKTIIDLKKVVLLMSMSDI